MWRVVVAVVLAVAAVAVETALAVVAEAELGLAVLAVERRHRLQAAEYCFELDLQADQC